MKGDAGRQGKMSEGATRKIVVLGSTGSVGRNALNVVRAMPGEFSIVGLSAYGQWRLLAEQIVEFGPEAAALICAEGGAELERAVRGRTRGPIRFLYGEEGLVELAAWPAADTVLSAICGAEGLPAALAAVDSGLTLALANKESLVMGGELLMSAASRAGAAILPVDSEHSAIFQAMQSGASSEVRRVIITASGGPCYGLSPKELAKITPEQALQHPNWEMGRKITVDSATLMNKALEIIEARWLFALPAEGIRVLIHPQSIVHGMVEFMDGSVMAQLGAPDMKLPIQYALTYPRRLAGPAPTLKPEMMRNLEFMEPDMDKCPALRLGYEVARRGGSSGAVLNAANECAVEAFLSRQIGFTDIVRLVETVVGKHEVVSAPNMEDILAADRWAREEARACLGRSET